MSIYILVSYYSTLYIYIIYLAVYIFFPFVYNNHIDTVVPYVVRPGDMSQNDHCVQGRRVNIKIIKVAITRTPLEECFFYIFLYSAHPHGRPTHTVRDNVGRRRRLRTRYTRFTVITAPYLAYYFII